MSPVPLIQTRTVFRRRRTGLAVAAVAAIALLGVSCSSDEGSDGAAGSTTTGADGSAADEGSGSGTGSTPAGPAATPELVRLEVDLDRPIAAVPSPAGGLLVAQRGGEVVEVTLDDDGAATGVEPVVDVTERVGSTGSERGLLGLAVAPEGDELYLSYTRAEDGASVLEAFPLEGGTVDVARSRTLLEVDQPYENHNGGHIAFGPDGMLYLGLGDGGAGGDPEGNAQDRGELLGKILRLDPDAPDLIPADNPFADGADGARPEIWATGVRNPWRFSFDRETGDLWVADVGQNEFEEIDLLPAADGGGRGANLGWDLYEGTEEFADADPAPGAASEGPFVEPIHTYARDGGCSITGGVVYRGAALAGLQGRYLFADYCVPELRSLTPSSPSAAEAVLDTPPTVVSFAEDAAGEIYLISLDEGLFRLRPKAG